MQLLLGVILSDHIKETLDYTEDDLIITQALDSATDWYMKNFYHVLKKYTKNGDSFNPTSEEIRKYDFMFQWANSNRILNRVSGLRLIFMFQMNKIIHKILLHLFSKEFMK